MPQRWNADRLNELSRKVDNGFARMEQGFAEHAEQITRVDRELEEVKGRLDGFDKRFEQIDGRFAQIEARFAQVDKRLNETQLQLGFLNQRFTDMTPFLVQLQASMDNTRNLLVAVAAMITTLLVGVIGILLS